MSGEIELIGTSQAMAALRTQMARLLGRHRGSGRLPAILIQGETGVGKGLLARALHHASARSQGPWVEVNCAAIPENLVESELFGVERGAFTDARQSKPGLFQAAHRGVLFLDEIGTLSLAVQAKLLTALEQRQVRRLGSTRPEPVDVWIISATNEDLPAAVEQKRFRADLYHRMAAVTLRLPPLRDRGDDVLMLAEHYLARACDDYGLPRRRIGGDAKEALLAHAWPGNVRELANLMERVSLLSEADEVTPEMLELPPPTGRRREAARGSSPEQVENERDALLVVLNATQWNLSRAAARLAVPRNTLRYRIEKHGLRPPEDAAGPPAAVEAAPAAALAQELRWERRWVTALRLVLAPPRGLPAFQLAPLLGAIADKARSFGAHLEELHPEGFVALFGIEPMEDAPSRAVHAVWAAQKEVTRTHPDARVTGVMHVAECLIGRGAVVGMDPTDRRTLMTRLDALVADVSPGQLAASAELARFLDRRFEMTSVRGHHLVGRGRAGFEAASQMLSPLVGRDRDLAMLDDLLAQTEQGHGQAVGIVGEPGVGKSRLLYEFCRSLGPERVRVLRSHCVAYGTTIPYWPILELVRQNFLVVDTDTPESVRARIEGTLRALALDTEAVAPYLLNLLGMKTGDEGPLAMLSPEVIKSRTIEALRLLGAAGSRRRPTVVVVEDLHWIDQTSEETLVALAESLPASRMLLLVTYRPGYRPPWLGKSYATQMVLRRLSRSDSAAIVRALCRDDALPAALTDTIVTHADGVPFFLEELTRAVTEHTDLRTAVTVPDTVQGVLTARLDRLPSPDRQLVQAASVLGRHVSVPLLRALVPDVPDAEFRLALAQLQVSEFLLETSVAPVPVVSFKHALTQDVAYQSLLPERRRALHAAAAAAIEQHLPDVAARTPEVLAHHYTEAALPQQAIGFWLRAGQLAVTRSANTEAVSHLRKGLALLADLPESPERLQTELVLLLTMATPLMMIQGYGAAEAAEAFERAQALCDLFGHSPHLFPALFGLWRFHLVRANHRHADDLADQLCAIAASSDDAVLTVGAGFAKGLSQLYLGRPAEAQRHLEIVVQKYEPSQQPAHLAMLGQDAGMASLAHSTWALWLQGRPEVALTAARDALRMAREAQHPFGIAVALHFLSLLHQFRGEHAEAKQIAEDLLVLAREHQFPFWIGLGQMTHGGALVGLGEIGPGCDEIRGTLTAYQASGALVGCPYYLGVLARAQMTQGRLAEADRTVDEGLALAGRTGERWWEAELLRTKAEILLEQGSSVDDVRSVALDAQRLASEQGARLLELRCAVTLARLATSASDRAWGLELVRALVAKLPDAIGSPDLAAMSALDAPGLVQDHPHSLAAPRAGETVEPIPAVPDPVSTAPEQPAGGPAQPVGALEQPAGETPLVGRQAELTRLEAELDAVWDGRGRLVSLLGDAGIGKSRLAHELARRAERRGGRVVIGHCFETEQGLPFAPWVDALRAAGVARDAALLEMLEPVWRGELARLLPELRAESSPPGPGDALRLFDAVVQLLDRMSARQPVLLVLEDVHWADEMSLRLIAFLGRRIPATRILLVATVRSEETANASLRRFLGDDLARERLLLRLPLSPLSRAETDALVHALRTETADRTLEDEVWRVSEGNPFIAVETVRALADGPAGAPRELAASVRQLVASRLDRLSERSRRLASVAAAIGRQFEFALLAHASGLSESDAAEGVEELVHWQILHQVREGFAFTHDRIREVAYDELLRPRRALLHRRIAEALEAMMGAEGHALAIGTHYREGEVWDKAVTFLQKAGLEAAARMSTRDAVACYDGALSALGRLPGSRGSLEREADLRFSLGHARYVLCEFAPAIESYRAAEALSGRLGDEHRRGHVLAGMSYLLDTTGHHAQALEAGQRALAISHAIANEPLRVWTALGLARGCFATGQYGRAGEHIRSVMTAIQGMPLAERFGRASILASVATRTWLAMGLARTGDFAEAESLGAEAIEIAGRYGGPAESVAAHYALGRVHLGREDFPAAAAVQERVLSLCRAGAMPLYTARLLASLASAYAHGGRLAEALPLLDETLQQTRASGIAYEEALIAIQRAEALGLARRWDDARRQAREALDLTRARGERGDEAWALHTLAWLGHETGGAVAQTVVLYREALALAEQLAMRPLQARCRLGLERVATA
jgi:predicted ATPase